MNVLSYTTSRLLLRHILVSSCEPVLFDETVSARDCIIPPADCMQEELSSKNHQTDLPKLQALGRQGLLARPHTSSSPAVLSLDQ